MIGKSKDELDKFKALLDDTYAWPDYYRFKFIVKSENKDDLLDKLPNGSVEEKDSKKGNYVSITLRVLVYSSDEVLSVYETASQIEGIISL